MATSRKDMVYCEVAGALLQTLVSEDSREADGKRAAASHPYAADQHCNFSCPL